MVLYATQANLKSNGMERKVNIQTGIVLYTSSFSRGDVVSPRPSMYLYYLAKKISLFGHLFFNITGVFCAKKRVGHACICPKIENVYWPASFEVIPPPIPKVGSSAATKMKNPCGQNCCFCPKISAKISFFFR